MPREIGPREKALREMREDKIDREIARRAVRKVERNAMIDRITNASQKRGKPRKAKK